MGLLSRLGQLSSPVSSAAVAGPVQKRAQHGSGTGASVASNPRERDFLHFCFRCIGGWILFLLKSLFLHGKSVRAPHLLLLPMNLVKTCLPGILQAFSSLAVSPACKPRGISSFINSTQGQDKLLPREL